jgi:hypothetical protein
MKEGFGKNKATLKAVVNGDELNKLIKQYKKIKKYRKSSIYTLKVMDGSEELITSLLKEIEDE